MAHNDDKGVTLSSDARIAFARRAGASGPSALPGATMQTRTIVEIAAHNPITIIAGPCLPPPPPAEAE